MFAAFNTNYGHEYKVFVNVWDADKKDYKQGFMFDTSYTWLALNEHGHSYFIVFRPINS